MSNSFYYFFSAVPQVLGGILALFGVFVVFKIQISRTLLFGIGKSIFDLSNEQFIMQHTALDSSTTTDITSYIQKGNTKGLYDTIKKIHSESFTIMRDRYVSVYDGLQKLINRTIIWSIITTTTIVICLIVIPLGNYMLTHIYVLYSLFGIISLSIMTCCVGLIYILKSALRE